MGSISVAPMPSAVDIFCGSGGVTQGLRSARWRVLVACDNDPTAAATFKKNHRRTKFVLGDIRLPPTVTEIERKVGKEQVDLVVICAPCQPFSSQNRRRGNDDREQLIVKALDVVEKLKPALVFFENVPGLATQAYASIVAAVHERLNGMGYAVSDPMVRDAADFGVPQRRRRCIMLAGRSNAVIEAFVGLDVTAARRTVFDAIADLDALQSGEQSENDRLHRARSHTPIALERLKHIPKDGGSRSSLPKDLELSCHAGRPRAFSDVYGRMPWKDVAPTLTTGCTDVTRGRFAHPSQDRAITLREAARLQSFPDRYTFTGNLGQIAEQIGNAVPPAMVKAFAPAFRAALKAGSGA